MSERIGDRDIKPTVKTFNSLTQLGLLGNSLEELQILD